MGKTSEGCQSTRFHELYLNMHLHWPLKLMWALHENCRVWLSATVHQLSVPATTINPALSRLLRSVDRSCLEDVVCHRRMCTMPLALRNDALRMHGFWASQSLERWSTMLNICIINLQVSTRRGLNDLPVSRIACEVLQCHNIP